MVELIRTDSPGEAAEQAKIACADAPVMNLVLSFPMSLPASSKGFLAAFREEALLWQSSVRPNVLQMSHGEYMHAHGDPIEYLTSELKAKGTSNRACISLVDSKPIMESGDGRLPSFMLLQVGFYGPKRDVLFLSAYYRALEVSAFLPINITEMALIAESIAQKIPSVTDVDITMHAFRAHLVEGFRAHRRSKIDTVSRTRIHEMVQGRDAHGIAKLLIEKSAPESIIEVAGLVALRIEVESAGWSSDVQDELDRAISAMTRLKTVRESGTHEVSIDELQAELTARLATAAELILNQ